MSRTRIKICGLTRVEDIQAVVAAGADAPRGMKLRIRGEFILL